MRVLLVGLGGVTATFRNWPERVVALALARRGHEVRAVGTHDPALPAIASERERIEGVDVRRVRGAYWPNLELRAALGEGARPDLVHLWHPRNVLAAQTTAWARRRGIPTLYTWLGPYHDEYLVADRERPFDAPPRYDNIVWTRADLLRRLAHVSGPRAVRDLLRNYRLHWPLKAARHLAPCSEFEAGEMRRMGLTQSQTVLPLWIEPAPAEPARLPPVAASRPWLLFVGQLTPRKGYDLALRAMPAVLERHPQASLLVVSGLNPAGRAELERLGAELGIADHVHFLGRLEDAELAGLLGACEVYLTPTRYEGFGLTVLEAMRGSAPVVATDVPVVNEIVRDGENGLLVPPNDPVALARAALRLIEDLELASRLRAGGRRTLETAYDPARLTARLESVYAEVLRGR